MIEIHVDENDTHLLLIASWNVSGGMGGEAGRHGEPGAGGAGGAGGEAHVWYINFLERTKIITLTIKGRNRLGTSIGVRTTALERPRRLSQSNAHGIQRC